MSRRALVVVVVLWVSQIACGFAQIAPKAGHDAAASAPGTVEPLDGRVEIETPFAPGAALYADDSLLLEEALQRMTALTWDRAESRELPLAGGDRIVCTVPQAGGVSVPGEPLTRGDLSVEYRFVRPLGDKGEMSPRVALLLPTADSPHALGAGAVGLQAQFPLVWRFSDRFEGRVNVGATWTPGQMERLGARADTFGYTAGARLVYHPADHVDLSLEALYSHGQTVAPDGSVSAGRSLFISPGIRFSLEQKGGGQIVPGIAFPIGIGPSAGASGVFVYLVVKR